MKLTFTDYWSGTHRPYRGVLHDSRDVPVSANAIVEKLAAEAGVVDGDEIEIVVRKTGNRPFGSKKMKRTKPHGYERKS